MTDDTQLAARLARSLAEQRRFDPGDIAKRYVDWYHSDPFDIGLMTMEALRRLDNGVPWDQAGYRVWQARPEGQNAGNGSVMRCAPLALAFHDDPNLLVAASRSESALTHYDPRCQYGCAVLNLTIANLLREREAPLQRALDRMDGDAPPELLDALSAVPTDVRPADLQTGGYVVTTLQTALYHGLTADSVGEAVVAAVNMGGDTDTIGAISGAVAGARFGADGLPDAWLDALSGVTADEIRDVTEGLTGRIFPQT